MKTTLIAITLLAGLIGGRILDQAGVFFAEEKYRESSLLYLEALNAYPDQTAAIHYNLGVCFLRQDSLMEAMRHFRAAINPSNPNVSALAANEMGILLSRLGQDRDALQSFREALVFDPDFEPARFNFELLVRRIAPPETEDEDQNPESDDPTPDQNTPESPLTDDELKQLRSELMVATAALGEGDMATASPIDTLSYNQALQQLNQLRTRQLQFLQQMVKTSKLPPRKTQRPDW